MNIRCFVVNSICYHNFVFLEVKVVGSINNITYSFVCVCAIIQYIKGIFNADSSLFQPIPSYSFLILILIILEIFAHP